MGGIQNNLNIRGSASLRDKPVPPSSRIPPVSLAPLILIAFPRSNTCHAGYGSARCVSRPRSSTNKYNQTLYARRVK